MIKLSYQLTDILNWIESVLSRFDKFSVIWRTIHFKMYIVHVNTEKNISAEVKMCLKAAVTK